MKLHTKFWSETWMEPTSWRTQTYMGEY